MARCVCYCCSHEGLDVLQKRKPEGSNKLQTGNYWTPCSGMFWQRLKIVLVFSIRDDIPNLCYLICREKLYFVIRYQLIVLYWREVLNVMFLFFQVPLAAAFFVTSQSDPSRMRRACRLYFRMSITCCHSYVPSGVLEEHGDVYRLC